jgi:cold shock CspA family protein
MNNYNALQNNIKRHHYISIYNNMSASAVVTSGDRFMGRVKWFNNKAGYGFITVTSGPKTDSDIFVHHKAVNVSVEQYRYLVQGEYIEFSLEQLKDSAHEFQAVNVSGINGGKLMCETRREFRQSRVSYKSDPKEESSEPLKLSRQSTISTSDAVPVPKSVRAPRARGAGPREGQEWTPVSKPRKPAATRPAKKPTSNVEA